MQIRRYTRVLFYGKKRLRLVLLLVAVLSLPLLKYLYDFPDVWKGSWQKMAVGSVSQFSPLYWVSEPDEKQRFKLPILSSKVDFKAWDKLSLADKCRFYFNKSIELDPHFTSELLRHHADDPSKDDMIISRAMEGLRIFDTCFISADLDISDVLGPLMSGADLHYRLYPFLAEKKDGWETIWPEIYHVNTQESVDHTKHISSSEKTFQLNNNLSFWNNWKQYSEGRGIVLTIGDGHVRLVKRLLKVLDYKENSYPIQIVYKATDLKEESVEDISRYTREQTKQSVYFVKLEKTLQEDWRGYISGFSNKLLAVVFSTFEEVILLDADVVPFANTSYFFSMEEYQKTGILLFRDRELRESTSGACVDMFRALQPSRKEKDQWNHRIQYNVTHIETVSAEERTAEEAAYYGYFTDRKLNHVDSGVVVVKRKEKLGPMLNSLMLAVSEKSKLCVYGDKELFWLGQLLSAQSFSIYPAYTGIFGSAKSVEDEKEICSAQMVHFDVTGEPLWVNGGLITCKLEGAAERAFEKIPEFYEGLSFNLETLKEFYESSPEIKEFIIPDVNVNPWSYSNLCENYFYCARASKEYSAESGVGYKKFNSQQLLNIEGVQKAWFSGK